MLYINNKNKKVYEYINMAINATNSNKGIYMVIYKDTETEEIYVREKKEFFNKFKPIEPYCGAVDNILNGGY